LTSPARRADGRLEIRVRDGAGRVRAYRIAVVRLAVLLLLPSIGLLAGGGLLGRLAAPAPDAELAARTSFLERENLDLRERLVILEQEVGLLPEEATTSQPVPFEPMDGEPTITVAVKRVAPSITFEGHGLTLGGATVTGAIEVRWTTEGMNLVDGRPVHDGTVLEADGPVYITGGGGAYPGKLRIYHEGSRILVVNELPMETYLQGVVGSELPASWSAEVKKAQAVAARSYGLVQRARREGYYALESSTLDQVFRPGATDARTVKAVEATRGQVLIQDDSLVEAFYHATCAGHTEAAAYVWPERGVPFDWSTTCDFCTSSPLHSWERSLSIAELSEALRREKSGMGIVTALKVLGRTPSGRARSIRLSTENGSVVLGGNDFRRIVGYTKVRSTRFDVEEVDEGLHLEGHGAGHGVGMCQWGAQGMVEADHEYRAVLEHYYSGASIETMYP
jgi:stage II sporulation protein D